MIERTTIEGRAATVAYITRAFEPATKDTFELAKIIFDDGEMVLVAATPDHTADPSTIASELPCMPPRETGPGQNHNPVEAVQNPSSASDHGRQTCLR